MSDDSALNAGAAAQPPVPTQTHRIAVSNFDSVLQAEMWLERGHEHAAVTFTAILRTALLLGSELVVDRNQLLDGVYFLALGPDRIAFELGLPPGADLPIVVNCQPGEAGDEDQTVPRMVGLEHDASSVSLTLQASYLRSEKFLRTSSALAALMGSLEDNSWLLPEPGSKWFSGCGFTDRLHPFMGDRSDALRVIEQAQNRWLEAMECGRIKVDTWNGIGSMQVALEQGRKRLERIRTDKVDPHDPAPLAEAILSEGAATNRRATAVGIVQDLSGTLGASDQDKRMALAVWSKAYYHMIAQKEDCMLISFAAVGGAGTTMGDSTEAEEYYRKARSYGLADRRRTRLERLRDKHLKGNVGEGPLRVNGEILDDMRIIDPGSFQQLQKSSGEAVRNMLVEKDPRVMFDLALASKNAVTRMPSHSNARISGFIKTLTLTLLAVFITGLTLMTEFVHLSNGQKAAAVIAAALLGLVASMPWDQIGEQLSLRPTSMAATLDIMEAQ